MQGGKNIVDGRIAKGRRQMIFCGVAMRAIEPTMLVLGFVHDIQGLLQVILHLWKFQKDSITRMCGVWYAIFNAFLMVFFYHANCHY